MNTLLVPVDFSETSVSAYRFALELAAIEKSKVVAVNVIDLPIKQLELEAKEKFEALESKFNIDGIDTSLFVELGGIVTTIEQMIADQNPTAVIMGTRGAKGLKEIVVGSNTEKIIRNSPVPVWAIPHYVQVSKLKTIVVPFDLRTDNAEAIERIKDVQKLLGAEAKLLYINTALNKKDEDEALNELKIFQSRFGFSDSDLFVRTAYDEADGIIQFAKEVKADMVAMITHARKGISHWLSGSLTEEVANHIEFPIFTTHL